MMKRVFCFYDMKVGIFGTPFFCRHVGEALRIAQQLASDGETVIGRHPADFSLVEIGEFDDTTGAMVAGQHVSHGVVAGFLAAQARMQGALFGDREAAPLPHSDERN